MIKDAYLWNASIANKFYSIDFIDFYNSDPDEYVKEIVKYFKKLIEKSNLITSKAKSIMNFYHQEKIVFL